MRRVVGASATAPPHATPESYTPRHLAESILTSRGALEGERKQVTVLFADIKGSLELLADRDPEEARKLLDPVLERMMEAVHRYEGTVNQVMGDGIMALFGAPLAHEDHAVRACYAALAMQQAISRYTEQIRRGHGVEVQIRIGLNSGEVVVRAIGSDLRMDYSAVGQTTHLAARMEQLATPGTTRLTGETLRLADGFVHVTPLGPMPVKGVAGPVEVFELLGASATRTRLQAAAARGLTRFVGRDREIEHLRRARAGGQGAASWWPSWESPASGKSRLFWEFIHSHQTHEWLVLESSSVSYGKAPAFLPVIDLCKSYFGIEARDDARRDPREGHGPAPDPGRGAPGPGARASSPCSRCRSTTPHGTPSTPAAAPAHRGWAEADAAPGEPGSAALLGLRGSALGRRGDPGTPRRPGRGLADGARPPARQLPAGVQPRVGEQDLL